jgi:hypothetical protein
LEGPPRLGAVAAWGVKFKPEIVMPLRLPQDRREAALVNFGLVRAYWRLSEAARQGQGGDDSRDAIEADAIDGLAGAAAACGTVSEESVARVRQTLKEIFDEGARPLALV